MGLRGLVTDAEFAEKKQTLVAEQVRLKERIEDSDGRARRWFELAEKALLFANQAQQRFSEGSIDDKREILVALGSNFILKDKILRIQLQKPFALLAEGPSKSTWLGTVDGIRTFFAEHPRLIQWPRFCMREG